MKDIKLTSLCATGGCGAKIDAGKLNTMIQKLPVIKDENLLVGFGYADDAGVYKLTEELAIIQTLDFFPPIVDDPYLFGQIAAANALSDVYAMGGVVKTAMNIVAFPEDLDEDILGEILLGGAMKVKESGGVLCGGHSIKDTEPKYGLSVTGIVNPQKILANKGAQPGDMLILTKKLGVGIITAAVNCQLDTKEAFNEAAASMTLLNRYACEAMDDYQIHACTDITGFGFLGHLFEMVTASNTSAIIYHDQMPYINAALSYAGEFIITCAAQRNRKYVGENVVFTDVDFEYQEILFDPQTSGGLLISCRAEDALLLLEKIKVHNPDAKIVGQMTNRSGTLMNVI